MRINVIIDMIIGALGGNTMLSIFTLLKYAHDKRKVLLIGLSAILLIPAMVFVAKNFTNVIDSSAIGSCGYDKAKAVLGTDTSLTFFCNDTTYVVGEAFTSDLGDTTISAIYNISESNTPGWSGTSEGDTRPDITHVNFDDSFANFTPTDLKGWFQHDEYIKDFSNTQNFNTSEVTSLNNAFYYTGALAENFTFHIDNWDLSKVDNNAFDGAMDNAFNHLAYNARKIDIALPNLNLSGISGFNGSFNSIGSGSNVQNVTVDLSGLNISGLTNWNGGFITFAKGPNVEKAEMNLSNWKLGNVSGGGILSSVGTSADDLYLNLNGWSGTAIDMAGFLEGAGNEAGKVRLDLENWDIQIRSLGGTFSMAQDAEEIILNIRNLDLNNVAGLYGALSNVGSGAKTKTVTINTQGWDLSGLTDWGGAFSGVATGQNVEKAEINLSNWKLGDVSTPGILSGIGTSADDLYLNLSGWSGATINMTGFLGGVGNEAGKVRLDLENWDIQTITSSTGIFGMAQNAEDITVNMKNLDLSGLTSLTGLFSGIGSGSNTKTVTINAQGWDLSGLTNWGGIFFDAATGSNVEKAEINLSNWKLGDVSTPGILASGIGMHVDELYFNLNGWSGTAISMAGFLEGAGNEAGKVRLDLENWDIRVRDLAGTFNMAQNAEDITVNMKNLDLSGVTSLNGLLSGIGSGPATKSVILNTAGWDLSGLTDWGSAFSGVATGQNVEKAEINLSNWKLSSGFTDISSLFASYDTTESRYRPNLATHAQNLDLNLSGWNTEHVKNISYAFYGVGSRSNVWRINLDGWDTSSVTNMEGIFADDLNATPATTSGSLDLSSWDTSHVTNMSKMFENNAKINALYVADKWDIDNVIYDTDMFKGTVNIKGGHGTVYNPAHIDKAYAHIDASGNEGYLSRSYTLTIKSNPGTDVSVERLSSKNVFAKLGTLNSGDTIYPFDQLRVAANVEDGYTITKQTINGAGFTSGDIVEVRDNLLIETEAQNITPGGGTEVMSAPDSGFLQYTAGAILSVNLGVIIFALIGLTIHKWLRGRS